MKAIDASAIKTQTWTPEKTETEAGTETGRHTHTHTHTERKRRQLFGEANRGIDAGESETANDLRAGRQIE